MDSKEILDSPELTRQQELFQLIRWWERLRILYNVLVFLAGIHPFYVGYHALGIEMALAATACYALGANFLYTLGWLPEAWCNALFNKTLYMHRYKIFLFIVGLAFSVFCTLYIGVFMVIHVLVNAWPQ